jgi:uncharacterized protein YjbJ (UPF0337 family)
MFAKNMLGAKWKQMRGKVKEQWGKLTNNDLDRLEGKRDQLVGLIQERYGYSRHKAEQSVSQFLKKLNVR